MNPEQVGQLLCLIDQLPDEVLYPAAKECYLAIEARDDHAAAFRDAMRIAAMAALDPSLVSEAHMPPRLRDEIARQALYVRRR